MRIACFGSGSGKEGDPSYEKMREVGFLLVALKKCDVLTGGFNGSGMEAPAKGATEAGGESIGFTILGKSGNPYLTEVVNCGEGFFPEVQYGMRLGNLLTADGFIVEASGGMGTLVELVAAINLSLKFWDKPKKIAVLTFGEKGHMEQLLFILKMMDFFTDEMSKSILVTDSPAKAVDWVTV